MKDLNVAILFIFLCILIVSSPLFSFPLNIPSEGAAGKMEVVNSCLRALEDDDLAGYQKMDYCKTLVNDLSAMKHESYSTVSARHRSFWKCVNSTSGERGIENETVYSSCLTLMKEIEK